MFALVLFALMVITYVLSTEVSILTNVLFNFLVWSAIVSVIAYLVGLRFPR